MRIGILGGSFNPPHEGHVHISKMVLKAFNLHAIWWLVTPLNPLKSKEDLPDVQERLSLCQDLLKDQDPRIIVTDIEEKLKTQHSYATVKKLKHMFPSTQFSWITGMDNAHNLHLWNHWTELLDEICMIHITRHPAVNLVKTCPSRMLKTQKHITVEHGGNLPLDSNTTYWLLQKKMVNMSSTKIRESNKTK
ncbi:MAG: nicotinate (nicotinamide) nucleotide adenylyltransferase [Alphaproteobacteria bacterium]|nr:nicotinate (nicotinamide) nucleotide adenylyltransferase [Alphaproteobacteria bacterium]